MVGSCRWSGAAVLGADRAEGLAAGAADAVLATALWVEPAGDARLVVQTAVVARPSAATIAAALMMTSLLTGGRLLKQYFISGSCWREPPGPCVRAAASASSSARML